MCTSRKGFTLIELLIVIAIIAILAATFFSRIHTVGENERRIEFGGILFQKRTDWLVDIWGEGSKVHQRFDVRCLCRRTSDDHAAVRVTNDDDRTLFSDDDMFCGGNVVSERG